MVLYNKVTSNSEGDLILVYNKFLFHLDDFALCLSTVMEGGSQSLDDRSSTRTISVVPYPSNVTVHV